MMRQAAIHGVRADDHFSVLASRAQRKEYGSIPIISPIEEEYNRTCSTINHGSEALSRPAGQRVLSISLRSTYKPRR